QEPARFFANTRHLIEKVKETRLNNTKCEAKIRSLNSELAELRSKYETQKEEQDSIADDKIRHLSEKLVELEQCLKQSENMLGLAEREKAVFAESYQKCLRDKTELELALRARESESSLQISQTELALSRLTALRSQLTQLQTINERIEEFLSRFKSSVSSVKMLNQRLECDQLNTMQVLEEKDAQIQSLQEEILRLNAENEALKCQINLECRANQYAKTYYDEKLRVFEQMKQKMETIFCTIEGTISAAEQSGTLIIQLRTMLKQ
uniref:CCD18 protein n=1 Tax=Mesocestoides corti TaxID=53468 RepID=A0A5K3FMU4_MESCO